MSVKEISQPLNGVVLCLLLRGKNVVLVMGKRHASRLNKGGASEIVSG